MVDGLFSDLNEGFWQFGCPTRVFACLDTSKARETLLSLAGSMGIRPVVVTDEGVASTHFFHTLMKDYPFPTVLVGAECDYGPIMTALHELPAKTDLLIAVGGGSVMDAAKCIAVCADAKLAPKDLPRLTLPPRTPLPLICVPTSFGTGSEVNQYSHLSFSDGKVSFKKSWLTPAAAILVSNAALEMSERGRFLTATDAWVHVVEARTLTRERSPFMDALLDHALSLSDRYFEDFIRTGRDQAGSALAMVSCIGGMGIHNARTGLIHTLAVPFAELTGIPHNQSLLPFIEPVLRFNWTGSPAILGKSWERLREGTLAVITERAAEIFDPRDLKNARQQIPRLVSVCMKDRVLIKENPVPLTSDSFFSLYEEALKTG